MTDFWFKPKTHGYGAYPTGWRGWALIAAFVIGLQLIMWPFVVGPALTNVPPTIAGLAGSLTAVALATWVFLRFVRAKTDGEWSWRWPEKK